MNVRIDNIVRFNVTKGRMYSIWLRLLLPFHKLSPKLIEVATQLIIRRDELLGKLEDKSLLKALLLSSDTADVITQRLNLSKKHYYVCIHRLKEAGFIKGDDINHRFLPKLSNSQNYNLLFYFDLKTGEDGGSDEHDQGED